MTEVFDHADKYVFQLWAPVVPRGLLIDGLTTLSDDFESGGLPRETDVNP